MKAINNNMRIIVLLTSLLISLNMYSQNKIEFVRVYNLGGKKIDKGHIIYINDSIISLRRSSKQINIKRKDIGFIRTKRSAGNNVLLGAASGATLGAVIGVSTADPESFLGYSAGEGALGFGTIGALGGAAIGGISIAFKKSETFFIDGDVDKWKIFKEMIEKKRLR